MIFRYCLVIALAMLFASAERRALAATCDGPASCCPSTMADQPPHVEVSVGVVLLGFNNVNERAGTWDADFYLSEAWAPTDGFFPQTEIVNEVDRRGTQFDNVELRRSRCIRSRRIHATLRNAYNLRTFPFDHQRLKIELSDAQFPVTVVTYSDRPGPVCLDDTAREALTSWKIEDEPTYGHAARVFRGEEGGPTYDYATVSLPVRRHITFHLAKFFLPLLVIVVIAFSVFWIEPSDLSSKATIGVTCLLAAIAFQLAEAGNLPEVGYLTLADRVYPICYIGIAFALVVSTCSTAFARKERLSAAARIDRASRYVFPAILASSLVFAVVRSLAMQSGPANVVTVEDER